MTANLPVQAVEAAARAIHRGDGSTSKEEWESLPLEAILGFRALARLALSAALPHLAPTVDRDTIARALALTDDYDGCFERLDRWAAATEEARECGEVEEPASTDTEDAEFWLRRADAVLTLLADQPTVAEVRAQALDDALASMSDLLAFSGDTRWHERLRILAGRERGVRP